MITNLTVFVLGAGASMPYRFPSGAILRRNLCKLLEADARLRYISEVVRPFGFNTEDVRTFADTFRRSGIASIDAFLGRRGEFVELGKLLIAIEIIQYESGDLLLNAPEDDWYNALWNALTSEAHTAEQLRENKVRFVTFNYDRSLECMLHESTKNTFALADEYAHHWWTQIPIVHFYGLVGRFCYQADDSNGRQYVAKINEQALALAVKGIRIVPEARENDPIFGVVRQWFREAARICFLGFGYDALNVTRLGLADVIRERQQSNAGTPVIYGSAFERSVAEMGDATRRVTGGHAGLIPGQTNWKNLQFLREHGLLL